MILQRWLINRIQAYRDRGGGRMYNVSCNFSPSCSDYAIQAIAEYGSLKGLWLTLCRLRRCNQRDAVEIIDDPLPQKGADPCG